MTKNEYLLIKLAEECGELTQAVSKVLLFGEGDCYKDNEPNTDRLIVEMNDVYALMMMVSFELGLWKFKDDGEVHKKKQKVFKFMDYSRDRGILIDEKI